MPERFTGLLLDLGYTSAGPPAEGTSTAGPTARRTRPSSAGHDLRHRQHHRCDSRRTASRRPTRAHRGAGRGEDRAGPQAEPGRAPGHQAAATSASSGDTDRHKSDFALLATMIRPTDDLSRLATRERQHLRNAMAAVATSTAAHRVPGRERALRGLERARALTTWTVPDPGDAGFTRPRPRSPCRWGSSLEGGTGTGACRPAPSLGYETQNVSRTRIAGRRSAALVRDAASWVWMGWRPWASQPAGR